MNAGNPVPPGMHPQQRPSVPPGAGFQGPRVGNQMPNTPSGKRPQDARGQMGGGQPKG